MFSASIEDLEEGAVFDCDLYADSGHKLCDPFTFLRSEQIDQLREWGIDQLHAESGPLSDEELQKYRRKAREKREQKKTTTKEIFEVEDPVSAGNIEPAESIRDSLKQRVRNSYEKCLEGTKKVLRPLSQGRIEDAKTLYDIAQPVVGVAFDMKSALLYYMADRESDEDDYIFSFSLHTCMISILLAREMGYDRAETRKVGVAGLIHDVGMLKIPQHIRMASGDLTDHQYETIQSHPERGARILSDVDRLENSVKRVAAEHHEQVNESGYPLGVGHEQIHPHARIVNLAMTFVGMTQNRDHRSSFTPQESIRELLKSERDRYDGRALRAFLKRFGLYPPGTFARLNTGQQILVLEPEPSDPKNPYVKVLTTPNNDPLTDPYEVHLSDFDVRIETVLDDSSIGSALELA